MCKVREKRNEFIVCVTLHHTMAHSLIACSRYWKLCQERRRIAGPFDQGYSIRTVNEIGCTGPTAFEPARDRRSHWSAWITATQHSLFITTVYSPTQRTHLCSKLGGTPVLGILDLRFGLHSRSRARFVLARVLGRIFEFPEWSKSGCASFYQCATRWLFAWDQSCCLCCVAGKRWPCESDKQCSI